MAPNRADASSAWSLRLDVVVAKSATEASMVFIQAAISESCDERASSFSFVTWAWSETVAMASVSFRSAAVARLGASSSPNLSDRTGDRNHSSGSRFTAHRVGIRD